MRHTPAVLQVPLRDVMHERIRKQVHGNIKKLPINGPQSALLAQVCTFLHPIYCRTGRFSQHPALPVPLPRQEKNITFVPIASTRCNHTIVTSCKAVVNVKTTTMQVRAALGWLCDIECEWESK